MANVNVEGLEVSSNSPGEVTMSYGVAYIPESVASPAEVTVNVANAIDGTEVNIDTVTLVRYSSKSFTKTYSGLSGGDTGICAYVK